MNTDKQKKDKDRKDTSYNTADRQGVDKVPEEEIGKRQNVTSDDLKGKKVDADPEKESDKPLEKKHD